MSHELTSIDQSSKWYKIASFIAVAWACFQIYISTSLPIYFSNSQFLHFLAIDSEQAKYIHLFFATCLCGFSASYRKNKHHILIDKMGFIAILISVSYLLMNYVHVMEHYGSPSAIDIAFSCIGVLGLMYVASRVVGNAIVGVVIVFLLYTKLGQFMPFAIAHKGFSAGTIAYYQWSSNNGIFGMPLGIITRYVYIFVLFGCLLDAAGIGKILIHVSLKTLRNVCAGPAKVSVVASGIMGMMSGSSLANTMVVGSFTIPLMRDGMKISPEKAAAIEASTSIVGQLTPPVMGAAGFIIPEYTGIPYPILITKVFYLSFLLYLSLFYMVHLEALKGGFKPKSQSRPFRALMTFASTCFVFSGICGVIYAIVEGVSFLGIGGIANWFGEYSFAATSAFVGACYTGIIYLQSKFKDDDESAKAVLISGSHLLIPIFILMWNLMIDRKSPEISALSSIAFVCLMLLTRDFMISFFRSEKPSLNPVHQGFKKILSAMFSASFSMITISIAVAVAGMIMCSVSMTGIAEFVGNIVGLLGSGSLVLALPISAIACLIIGMGMPTTVSYLIGANVIVPIILSIIQANHLNVPLLAMHIFVLYFGLIADITPPVGLAATAAAAIAKANPLKTCMQACIYNIRVISIPFLIIANPTLIMCNLPDSTLVTVFLMFMYLIGIILICASSINYFITHNKIYESVIFMICGITLMLSGALMHSYAWIIAMCLIVTSCASVAQILRRNATMKHAF